MIDTLIVGFGIAGLNYAEQLRQHNRKFIVLAPKEECASKLAAGIINPTVLKRFNSVWKSDKFLNYALAHYNELQDLVQTKIIHRTPILRIINNKREQNEWVSACSKPFLKNYLNNNFISGENYNGIKAPFNYGEVKKSAKVDNITLISSYQKKIIPNQYIDCRIDHTKLEFNTEGILYKGIQAKKIVFCEGFHNVKNPFFNYLPLVGSKGEMLIIKCNLLTNCLLYTSDAADE